MTYLNIITIASFFISLTLLGMAFGGFLVVLYDWFNKVRRK